MNFLTIPIILILSLITPLWAIGEETLSLEDQQEFDRLMGVLDKHTDIATATKMNADYIPGMVTVLEGRDMENLGKRNVMEALTLVPGLDISISQGGTATLTSRGIGSPYLSSTALIMLNGVNLNNTTTGSASITFAIPIEQVDRIEIIRGSGTAINGEFAYNSVINIITRTEGNNIHASYGRFDTFSGGGMASYETPDQNIKFSLNFATSRTDGADHAYGPDSFSTYGHANEDRRMHSLFANFKYKDFSVTSSYAKAKKGSFFEPYPNDEDHLTSAEEIFSIEAKQVLQPMPDLNMIFKAGWQQNNKDLHHMRLLPPGHSLIPGITYPDGLSLGYYNEEEKFLLSQETTWTGITNNTLTFAFNYNYTKLNDVYLMGNYDPLTYQPTPWHKLLGDDNFMDEDATRNHISLALQDEFHLTKYFTIMAGLRYDYYSDVEDDQFSPQISALWQPAKNHIFKMQYARAFRPPTFMELTGEANFIQGNERLNSETIDTYEVGYIYRGTAKLAKITLFYSDLDDLITSEFVAIAHTYTNNGAASQTGFELEYGQKFLEHFKFCGNLSYTKTKDDKTHEEVRGSSNWLANLGLTYFATDWATINTQYRYVGKRHRTDTDLRSDLKSYNVVDLTLSFFPQIAPGLTLRVGLKNIFDARVDITSTERSFIGTSQADDYPVLDRFYWLQATYDF